MPIFLIFVLSLFGYVIANTILDNTASTQKEKATLTKKYIDTMIDANNIMIENYILVFKTGTKVKKFSVRPSQYKKYEKLDKGELIYKRNKFVDFIRKNK